MSKNKDKAPEAPKPLSLDDLRLLIDPIVESLSKKVGERGAVVMMVSAPNGAVDSYYVRWSGPLLTARGLREEGGKLLDGTIAKPISSVQTGPA